MINILLLPDVIEFRFIIVTEKDIVQVQLRELPFDPPINYQCGTASLLVEYFLWK